MPERHKTCFETHYCPSLQYVNPDPHEGNDNPSRASLASWIERWGWVSGETKEAGVIRSERHRKESFIHRKTWGLQSSLWGASTALITAYMWRNCLRLRGKKNKPSMSQFLALTQNWGRAIPLIRVKNLIILRAVYNQNDITYRTGKISPRWKLIKMKSKT